MSYIGKGVETVTFNTATTLDVAGNITLGGTVDGRDVATDGTKLDTITSGAIADILQDTTPQLGGNLDLNTSNIIGTGNINVTGSITGTSFVSTGNMSFTNNSKAIFGTSPSLEIYHDGSNSILDDVGAGNFKMQLAGADKLEITSTGVSVTGTVTASGDVIRNDSTLGTSKFALQYSGADAAVFKRNNSTGVATIANGYAGAPVDAINISLAGNVGIGTLPVANIPLTLQGPSGYTDTLSLKSVGTNIDSRINIAPTGTGNAQINNTVGTAIEFQTSGIERMRIDSNGNVGIGTSSPSTDISKFGGSAKGLSVAAGQPAIAVRATANSQYVGYFGQVSTNTYLGAVGGGSLIIQTSTSGTERMRIDSNGNVTIQPAGTTTRSFGETVAIKVDQSAPTRLSVRNDNVNTTASAGITLSGSGNSWAVECGSSAKNGNALTFALDATAATPSEKMRITNGGNLLLGTTSLSFSSGGTSYTPKFAVDAGSGNIAYFKSSGAGAGVVVNNTYGSGTRYLISFDTATARVGDITTNGTSTTYGSPSDYRLKENVTADWDATTRLKQLKPVRFNFIADADTTVDGFLAHEVQDVVPEAITGTKDAVDHEGNPEYQGIDQSKLVPLLVKTIQELEARIAALENT